LGLPQISNHLSIAARATGRMGNLEIESAELKVGHQVVCGAIREMPEIGLLGTTIW